jgi:two-component system LytT family response regulator
MILHAPVRTLIVDDEAPARLLLRSLLEAWPRLDIVGEAEDGSAAVSLMRAERPDLVFLDVQMPVRNGFEVVAEAADDVLPLIVFVTAYDQYALKAFEVSACDYLLKPFDEERLNKTVRRALDRLDEPARARADALRTLLLETQQPASEQVVVKVDGRHVFLDADEIDWIEADGKTVRLHMGKNCLVVRTALSKLEERLSTMRFLRVHRSIVVNRTRIREIQPWFRGEYVLILRDGTRIVTGRHHSAAIRALTSGGWSYADHLPR